MPRPRLPQLRLPVPSCSQVGKFERACPALALSLAGCVALGKAPCLPTLIPGLNTRFKPLATTKGTIQ